MAATTQSRITKTLGVCGGDACIRGHRIPVWVLVGYRKLGASDAEILKADVIFRAVVCPRGRHEIRFTFHPFAGALAEVVGKMTHNARP